MRQAASNGEPRKTHAADVHSSRPRHPKPLPPLKLVRFRMPSRSSPDAVVVVHELQRAQGANVVASVNYQRVAH